MNTVTRLNQALTRWRAKAEELMTDTCTLRRAATTRTGGANTVERWSETTGVPCRRIARRSQNSEGSTQDQSNGSWSRTDICLPYDTVVAIGDQIVVGGFTYIVTEPRTSSPTRPIEVIVGVELAQKEGMVLP